MKGPAAILSLATLGAAFPSLNPDAFSSEAFANDRLAARQQAPNGNPGFNAAQQFVSTSGDHAFQMPDIEGGDQRGPCPGLNAAANHAYLPRSGVGSHQDFIDGTFKVFGMSADLSGFLTILGAVMDGDGLSRWSIGGPSKELPGLPPLLGQPQGISGSHNKYECDYSPVRGDLYTAGNDFSLQMDQHQQLYDMGIANGDNIDMTVMNNFRSLRYDQSLNNNPYFFNGPFTGVAVNPAAFYFIYRFMGNKSQEHPEGRLNTEILNSFMGVSKQADGSLKFTPGSERIPENFYKRAVGNEYSIPFLIGDIIAGASAHPKFISIGGNLGKTNSFVGIAPENFTGGLFNGASLLEGDNLSCYIQQYLTQAMPDIIKCSGIVGSLVSSMNALTSQLSASFGSLTCPKLGKLSTDQFEQFPGYKVNCKTGLYQ